MPEFMATPAIEAMLAEILAKLEAMQAPSTPPTTPPSPSSIPTHVAGIDAELEQEARDSASLPTNTPSTASAAASTYDDDYDERALTIPIADSDDHERVLSISTDDDLCILFDADGGGVDRLSRLPDTLLCHIISRLPIKDAVRTAVLSRRWLAAQFHAGLAVLYLNSTSSNVVMNVSAPPTPSPTFVPCLDAALDSQIGVARLFITLPTMCSTLGLYQVVATLLPATTASASATSTSTAKLFVGASITKHLLTTSPTNINHKQGNRIPKPPWLLVTELSRSWFGQLQLISGFLLEASPWCSDYTLWVQWLYWYACVPMKVIIYQDIKVDSPITTTEHLPVLHAICSLLCLDANTGTDQAVVAFHLVEEFKGCVRLRPKPWTSYCRYRAASQFLAPWTPPAQRLMIFLSCTHGGLDWSHTGCSCFYSYWEIHMCKSNWLQVFESAAQFDEGNSRGVADLILSNFYQDWLCTEILAVVKSLLLNGEVYLIKYFWSKHQISFPDLTPHLVWASLLNLASTLLENTELSLVQSIGIMHNYILKLAWDCVVCVRVMGHIEAVFALITVCSTYIPCDSSTPPVLVIQVFEVYTGGQFGQFLIKLTDGSKCTWGCVQLDLTKGPKHYRHFVILTHPRGQLVHDSVTPWLWLGTSTMFKDSVDTYCMAHDIKYTEAITLVDHHYHKLLQLLSTSVCWKQLLIHFLVVNQYITESSEECIIEDSEELQLKPRILSTFRKPDPCVCLRTYMMKSQSWVQAYLHSVRDIYIGPLFANQISKQSVLTLMKEQSALP